LEPDVIGKKVARKNIIDGRGVIDKEFWAKSGWDVSVLGEG
jgi:hypothetical protein